MSPSLMKAPIFLALIRLRVIRRVEKLKKVLRKLLHNTTLLPKILFSDNGNFTLFSFLFFFHIKVNNFGKFGFLTFKVQKKKN